MILVERWGSLELWGFDGGISLPALDMGIKHASSTIFNLDQQQMTVFIYPPNMINFNLVLQNNASILIYWHYFDFIYSPEFYFSARQNKGKWQI